MNPDTEPERCPSIVWERAAALEGWLTREEADLLWRYAEAPWCEVGTYRGRSAEILTTKGIGWCVDTFQFLKPSELPAGATPVKGLLQEVFYKVPTGMRFLYLDADHSHEATMQAWRLYAPKVKRGGYIALHDALELHKGDLLCPGVNSAISCLIREGNRLIAAAHRTVVFQR